MSTVTELAKSIVDEHVTFKRGDGSTVRGYEPLYFDRGFQETDNEVMGLYVSGDSSWREVAYGALVDWECDAVAHDARELADAWEAKNPDADIDIDELRDEIREMLHEEVTQDTALEWLQNMRDPLIRVQVGGVGEDDMVTMGYNDPSLIDDDGLAVSPSAWILKASGIPATDENVKACEQIAAEAFYPGCHRVLFLVFRASVASLAGDMDAIEVTGDVELWACNPWVGDGWSETVKVDGYMIPRGLLRTDDTAWGYSYCEVFGASPGLMPSPKVGPSRVMYTCDNCGHEEADPPMAKDLHERLDEGGPYTARECSKCGALTYLQCDAIA